MSLQFYPFRVSAIQKETNDCVSIVFNIPPSLQAQFAYSAGQYITLKKIINGEEVRRSYSLCSSPLENEWRIAVKKVDGGLFSNYANEELQVGDLLDVMPPLGKFTLTTTDKEGKKYLFFTAGSGITPVLSIIKTILQTEPSANITLVYGNKNVGSIIFKEQIEALKNKYTVRLQVIHILSRERTDAPLFHGRIDQQKCEQLCNKLIDLTITDECFICGPEEMTLSIRDFIVAKGFDRKKVHVELFNTQKNEKAKTQTIIKEDNTAISKITVKLDGRSFDFDLALAGNSILDAALAQGADLPFACKGGVCCTCKAKVLEGKVSMDVNWGLEEEEIEQGYVLTCQSHPLTESVVVDFDVK